MRSFRLDRRYALIIIPFNAVVHCITTDEQVACLTRCREHLTPGGLLAFDTFFPDLAIIGAKDTTRVLEGETTHPETGLPVRVYDTRTFDRVEQTMHSVTDIEFLDGKGNVAVRHPPQTTMIRWIYKGEIDLLLRAAGFDRWEIAGGYDGRPLVKETDAMIVKAWTNPGPWGSARTPSGV